MKPLKTGPNFGIDSMMHLGKMLKYFFYFSLPTFTTFTKVQTFRFYFAARQALGDPLFEPQAQIIANLMVKTNYVRCFFNVLT